MKTESKTRTEEKRRENDEEKKARPKSIRTHAFQIHTGIILLNLY